MFYLLFYYLYLYLNLSRIEHVQLILMSRVIIIVFLLYWHFMFENDLNSHGSIGRFTCILKQIFLLQFTVSYYNYCSTEYLKCSTIFRGVQQIMSSIDLMMRCRYFCISPDEVLLNSPHLTNMTPELRDRL